MNHFWPIFVKQIYIHRLKTVSTITKSYVTKNTENMKKTGACLVCTYLSHVDVIINTIQTMPDRKILLKAYIHTYIHTYVHTLTVLKWRIHMH
jgi:hypothetical protein